MDVFNDIRAKKSDIIKAGCELFKLTFCGNPPEDLEDLRFDIISKRAAAGSIKPEKLPPTTGAAAQHSLRAYLQTRDRLLLQIPSLDVLEYGWKQGEQGYAPVPTTDPIALHYLLKFVSCNCAGDCDTLRLLKFQLSIIRELKTAGQADYNMVSNQKKCPNCPQVMPCATKVCKACGAEQPKKARLMKRLQALDMKKREWLANLKKKPQ
ncbi:unnamed protein product [Leuciscus chuanchicus]